MQNRYRQLKEYSSLLIIGCILPFTLWTVCGILPTFDDFTTLQSPQFTSPLSKYLLPNNSFWRPWDYLFGCLLGWNTALFPTLNHIIIIIGHTINSLFLYIICKKLSINSLACNIATLFFFFSPASLGATLACDGLNQIYAQCWGLVALWIFLNETGRKRILLWGLCTMIAALSKENGLAWAVIPPLIAYAFNLINKKKTIHFFCIGISFAIVYFILRLSLKVSGSINNEYVEISWTYHIKDLIQILIYNWIPLDYMSIVYAPERNWLLASITLILSIPFLFLLLVNNKNFWKDKTLLILIVCFFIVASPHLITLVSIMHNYAPLAMSALMVAYLINRLQCKMILLILFTLFIFADIFTDMHHTIGALNSGKLGKKLALSAISQTDKPIMNAYCISIEDEETPKYSSFGVRPIDAFAWGLSVKHYTNYKWPLEINDTILTNKDTIYKQQIIDSVLLSGVQCVWVVNNKSEIIISFP